MKKIIVSHFLHLFIVSSALAQLDSVSTYPSTTSIGRKAGVSFEIVNSKHVLIHDVKVACNQGINRINVYHRESGVQSIPGVPPIYSSANGWNFVKTVEINSPACGAPVKSGEYIGLFLTPGTHGIYLEDTAYLNDGICIRHWESIIPDSYSNPSNNVRVNTGPNKGYGGPIADSADTVMFIGGIVFEVYTPLKDDIGILALDSPSFQCAGAGNSNVAVQLRNLGSSQISNLSIHWQVNGVSQPSYSFSGLIDTLGGSGNFLQSVAIGSYPFLPHQKYSLKIWTSQPNGNADPNAANDTLEVTYATGMNGIYTIDPMGSGANNYTTFNEAVLDLKTRGVCGPTIFYIKQGSYLEQVSMDNIRGTSASNTITFTPDTTNTSPVELKFQSTSVQNNYVIRFKKSSHIIVNGLHILPQGTQYSRAIVYEELAHHIELSNNEIINPVLFVTSEDNATIYGSAYYGGRDDNVIANNHISGGSIGIYLSGESPQGRSSFDENWVIKDNYMENPYKYGLYLNKIAGLIVDGNYLVSNVQNYGTSYAMRLSYAAYGAKITNNTILSPGLWPTFGIRLEYAVEDDTLQRGFLANNMIHAGDSNAIFATEKAGIYIYGVRNFDIVHNNVVLENHPNFKTSAVAYFSLQSYQSTINVANNNFLNYGTGFAIHVDTSEIGSNVFNMDYNNLATNGSNLVNLSGNLHPDLSAWQSAGYDQHSISAQQIFTNLDSLRTCDSRIANKGTNVGVAPQDIDDEVRSITVPDIGADEFSFENPALNLGPDLEICKDSVILQPQSEPTIKYGQYSWSTGATSPELTTDTGGLYILSISNGCGAQSIDTVMVTDLFPIAGFDFNFEQGQTTTHFTNTSEQGVTYHWDFGDGQTSSLKDPTHTYAGNGTYEVVLTVGNDCDTVSITKTIVIDWVGISDGNGLMDVRVYPNPAKDVINIQFSANMQGSVQMQLLDLQGRLIVDEQVIINNGSHVHLDISALTKGMYMLQITGENLSIVNHRIVVE